MSWDIELVDEKGNVCDVDEHEEGGTYVLGGIGKAELNVTYNYGKHFDFKILNGRIAGEITPSMETTVKELGTDKYKDYWKPTKGNTGYAVSNLLGWANDYVIKNEKTHENEFLIVDVVNYGIVFQKHSNDPSLCILTMTKSDEVNVIGQVDDFDLVNVSYRS